MLTVKFDPGRVTEMVKVDLHENVEGLSDLDECGRVFIYKEALHAVLSGGNLSSLFKALMCVGLAKTRAEKVSAYLWSNALSVMEVERLEELGVTHAVWRHSGAPCGGGDQDAAHKEADGKRFPLCDGLYVNGEITLPGRKFECKCYFYPIVHEFDDF